MKATNLLLGLLFSPSVVVSLVLPQLVTNVTEQDWQAQLQGVYKSIPGSLQTSNLEDVVSALQGIQPIARPSSPEQFVQRLQEANSTKPANLYHYLANLRALNLIDSIDSLLEYAKDATQGEASSNNDNRKPPKAVYPKKLSCDAPYSVPESALRAAIYIPPSFTWGKKPPVILFPGTGGNGYTVFRGNFIPLLQNSDFADPVWVNVPGLLLDDAQTNSEYAAYAINYISAVTNQKVTVVGWSQGNINTQWAFKYWPSTRQSVRSHVAVSPDYAGTILANFITPFNLPMPASVRQQKYLLSSAYITTMRNDEGDSAYVPTTTVFSGLFDEIVEPQQGKDASAILGDTRNVGVTNNEVQTVCGAQPGGSFYTHEGVLYNPLAFALFKDVMKNGGPGRTSRLDTKTLCTQYLTPGLNVGDLLLTENAIAIAGLAILLHPKMPREPPTMRYAQARPVQDLAVCIEPPASTSAAPTSSKTTAKSTSKTSSKSTVSVKPSVYPTGQSTSPPHSTTQKASVHSTTTHASTTGYSYSYSYSQSPYSYFPVSYTYSYSPSPYTYSYSYSASPYTYSYQPASYQTAA